MSLSQRLTTPAPRELPKNGRISRQNPRRALNPVGNLWRAALARYIFEDLSTGLFQGRRAAHMEYPGLSAVVLYEYPAGLAEDPTTKLTLKEVFGDQDDETDLGMDVEALIDQVGARLVYVPAYASTSFVTGQAMHSFLHCPRLRPRSTSNGFVVELQAAQLEEGDILSPRRNPALEILTTNIINSHDDGYLDADVGISSPVERMAESVSSSFSDPFRSQSLGLGDRALGRSNITTGATYTDAPQDITDHEDEAYVLDMLFNSVASQPCTEVREAKPASNPPVFDMVSSIPFAALRSSSPVSSQGETSVFTAPTQDVPALPLALAREYAPASGIYDNHGSVSPNDAETCLFRLTPLVVHRGRSLSDPSALFSADDDSGLNTPLANQTCFPMSVSSQAELTTAIPESRGRALSESYLPNRPNDFESACKENMSMDTSMSANDSIGPPTPSESWPMLEGFAPRPSSCAPDTGYVFSDSLNILEGMSLPLSSSGCISGRLDCQLDGTASFASGVGLEGKENLHRRSRDLELLDA